MKNKFLLTLTTCLISLLGFSQDTLHILSYNILNYPNANPSKATELKTIIDYTNPDLLLVTELLSNAGANTLLNNALNQSGRNYYQKANFIDGPDTDNLLYYNSNKFGLVSQQQIGTVLRDISEYILYYKSTNLATTNDTAFFYIYIAHLKASSGSSNEQQRNLEASTLKIHLDNIGYTENIFFGGDFNLYSSNEPAYNTILNGGNTKLKDPINAPGNWNSNAAFANIHTQSTRTSNLSDGGSTGGLDDRFDFIFISEDVLTGLNQIKYIPNSYTVIGQDGNHFNTSLIAGTNNSVPSNVLSALYTMSDHLPVSMKVYYDKTLHVINPLNTKNIKGYFYNNTFNYKTNCETGVDVLVFDALGKQVYSLNNKPKSGKFALSKLKKGLYLVHIKTSTEHKSFKIIKN